MYICKKKFLLVIQVDVLILHYNIKKMIHIFLLATNTQNHLQI